MGAVAQTMSVPAGQWSIDLPASDRQQIEHIRDRCLAALNRRPWQDPNDKRYRGILADASALLHGERRPSSLIQVKDFRTSAELRALAGDPTALEIYKRQVEELGYPLVEQPRRKKGGPH